MSRYLDYQSMFESMSQSISRVFSNKIHPFKCLSLFNVWYVKECRLKHNFQERDTRCVYFSYLFKQLRNPLRPVMESL